MDVPFSHGSFSTRIIRTRETIGFSLDSPLEIAILSPLMFRSSGPISMMILMAMPGPDADSVVRVNG